MTTGTYSFLSFILNVASVGLLIPTTAGSASGLDSLFTFLVITQFLNQVKIKDISQLTNDMSGFLQELLKYFNGTTISGFFLLFLFSNFPVILVL